MDSPNRTDELSPTKEELNKAYIRLVSIIDSVVESPYDKIEHIRLPFIDLLTKYNLSGGDAALFAIWLLLTQEVSDEAKKFLNTMRVQLLNQYYTNPELIEEVCLINSTLEPEIRSLIKILLPSTQVLSNN